ncbi:hypothetical protein M438DRAFT_95570 [Aureobasidium pullulans EXF-150]|uniref:Uncharacterized protein n=1 Tax=Aureobasidium pullulans EXF-150 TaxID=1043002 RepID=A0A074Y483_AURPU|nr:uncharacterized protein M438DRAFT_95570 [Aureobasidium pullulans EXF-150]KEQ89017.1 hypothetical protein M438DRAFT_95570 [Aureobasidium pullulans EXF-150]
MVQRVSKSQRSTRRSGTVYQETTSRHQRVHVCTFGINCYIVYDHNHTPIIKLPLFPTQHQNFHPPSQNCSETLTLNTAQESNHPSYASTKRKMCEWQVIQFLTCLHYKNHCILRCQLMSGRPSWQACVPPSSDQRDLARSHDDRDVVAGMCPVCRGLTPRSSRDFMQA